MVLVITPPAQEPITVSDVKTHLRLSGDDGEDSLLQNLITTARSYCEHYTRRALAPQTLELLLDRFPASNTIELPCPPLVSITSIKYKNKDGVETTFASSDYLVDADREIGRVVLKDGVNWPVFMPSPSTPIRIRFVAGYAQLPSSIRLAILLLIGHWYESREATGIAASGETAFSVHALLSQYRMEAF